MAYGYRYSHDQKIKRYNPGATAYDYLSYLTAAYAGTPETTSAGLSAASYSAKLTGPSMANTGLPQWIIDALVQATRDRYLGSGSTATIGEIPEGSDIDVVSDRQMYGGRRRRRRRRLLTCSDKADIAFLHGQLGGGQLGRAAISALLSRRCG